MDSLRGVLRFVATISFALSAGLLLAAIALRSLEGTGLQLLLTAVGVGIGAGLTDVLLRSRGRQPFLLGASIVAIVVSQVCYLLLVWTEWRVESMLWRVWWLAGITALVFAHVGALRIARSESNDWLDRATPLCAGGTGILVLWLAVRPDLLASPGIVYVGSTVALGTAAAAGSIVIWSRHKPIPVSLPVGRWHRFVLAASLLLVTFLVGFYLGRVSAPPESVVESFPSVLRNLTREEIERQVQDDLRRLKVVFEGLRELEARVGRFRLAVQEKLASEDRSLYLPEEDSEIRSMFLTYLAYRSALLRMLATYSGFETVRYPATRARCFLVGYAAAMTAFRSGLELVHLFRDDPLARRKLNEPEPSWGIPPGMFDRIYQNVAHAKSREVAEEMAAFYERNREEWRRAGLWPDQDFDLLAGQIDEALALVRERSVEPHRAIVDRILGRVKQDAYTPVYAVQSLVSEWVGDARIMQRPPFVTIEQIQDIEAELEPGDILLERRNWFLSNAFLPGFWPHAALYVGREEDLVRLGIRDHPEVLGRLAAYRQAAPDGRDHTVIESVSEGVIFNSLTESMHADYVAVLRPRLPREQIGEAIVRAFSHLGKPYDFEFDFFTADKVVCTELVYRAYEGMLHFQLVEVMGRDTLPALEIVRKYASERGKPERELDFVLFLDGDAMARRARLATEQAFCDSLHRPRGFNE